MNPNDRLPLLSPYSSGLDTNGLPSTYYPQPLAMPFPLSARPVLPPPPPPPQYKHLEQQSIQLVIRQQPREGLLAVAGKERARKPITPPPVIELWLNGDSGENQHFASSPYLFMVCALYDGDGQDPVVSNDKEPVLAGTTVSSLHKLKYNDHDGAFFVFGDISVRVQGRHRFRFNLYDIRKDTNDVIFLGHILSEPFSVVLQKDFRGLEESTMLSRAFAEQGVRLRLKKEPRGYNSNKRTYGSFSAQGGFSQEESPPMKHEGIATEYSQEYSHDQNGQSGHYHDAKRLRGQGFFDGLAGPVGPMPPTSTYTNGPMPSTSTYPNVQNFWPNGNASTALYEPPLSETYNTCETDQFPFKTGDLGRWLGTGKNSILEPSTAGAIDPLLPISALSARSDHLLPVQNSALAERPRAREDLVERSE